jgi:hypothetical protein
MKKAPGSAMATLTASAALAAGFFVPAAVPSSWLILAVAAICPPLLFMLYWPGAGQTMSQSIQHARR